jgi:hypothetical protein
MKDGSEVRLVHELLERISCGGSTNNGSNVDGGSWHRLLLLLKACQDAFIENKSWGDA